MLAPAEALKLIRHLDPTEPIRKTRRTRSDNLRLI
jgi:hypothetical protein